jgi:DNA-binding response OmpR family regulator
MPEPSRLDLRSRDRLNPAPGLAFGLVATVARLMLARMAQVLVVEDEEDIAFPLVRTLEREGYVVTWLESGRKALEHLLLNSPDIMILDLGLPDMDGLDVCRAARESGFDGGIMIVTARAGELDRVVGLDFGADDYLSKPFGLAELQARVRALLRRSQAGRGVTGSTATETANGLRIDVDARRVTFDQTEVALTAKEFDVLALLAVSRDKVVSREQLMSEVWDENWFGSTKTLDVTIGRLRNKLEEAGAEDRVVAIRGVGFRLESGS